MNNSIGRAAPLGPVDDAREPEAASVTRGVLGAVGRLANAATASNVLALADQGIVSCASFLATIIIGRCTNSNELGLYSIGASLTVILIGVQGSLILLPYTIRRHAAGMNAEEFAGGSLAQSISFAAATSLLTAVAAVIFAGHVGLATPAMLLALSGAIPFILLREFARQIALAHLRLTDVVIVDLGAAVIQLTALCCLGFWGKLSAATAWAALGGGCAVTALAWLYQARAAFVIRLTQARTAARQSWQLAKWLLAAHLAGSLQRQVAYWLLAGIAGATVTGVFAACMSVVSFANPLIIGLCNALIPKAVVTFRTSGVNRLLRQAVWDALLLVSATMLFCAVIALAGESIMSALYHNREYEGQGATVTALALAVLHYAAGFPAANGLMTMQRPQAIVWASILGAIVTVSLVLPLFHMNGLLGAALAVLAGSAVEAAVRWAAFLINAFSSTQTVGRQAKARAISNPATGTIIAEGVGMDV